MCASTSAQSKRAHGTRYTVQGWRRARGRERCCCYDASFRRSAHERTHTVHGRCCKTAVVRSRCGVFHHTCADALPHRQRFTAWLQHAPVRVLRACVLAFRSVRVMRKCLLSEARASHDGGAAPLRRDLCKQQRTIGAGTRYTVHASPVRARKRQATARTASRATAKPLRGATAVAPSP